MDDCFKRKYRLKASRHPGCWISIPEHFQFVVLDSFIMMPDHIHGILRFGKTNQTGWQPNRFGPQSQNLASVIRSYKGAVKAFANSQSINFHWQPRYYERIIRNERELDLTRDYIMRNQHKYNVHHAK